MASSSLIILIIFSSCLVIASHAAAPNFRRDCEVIWGGDRVKIADDGRQLSLSLDNSSGCGFHSKDQYLFGRIDMKIKLVAGDSAGTVTAYYLTSKGSNWDEIDFEFLGNSSGEPYTVHTNVFVQGKGGREQQFHLWFDPTIKFHTYSIVWSLHHILFLVDNIPIRQYKNMESAGVPYPRNQPMRVVSTLWNADDWATRGGLVKTDWTKAPFTAYYRDFSPNACIWKNGASSCSAAAKQSLPAAASPELMDDMAKRRLMWVRRKFMVYNYCTDKNRFSQGLPTECK